MSYLNVPRLHLSGSFYTDPSTMDNDPTHYDPAVTTPSPWQEPNGRHYFRILDCAVTSVTDDNGTLQMQDPAVGATFVSVDKPVPAKLVDIDVYQQAVSTVYGMQVRLTCADNFTLTGTCDQATLIDAWFGAVLPQRSWAQGTYGTDSPGDDAGATGAFQTVIRFPVAQWATAAASPALNALKAMGGVVNDDIVLSFHFTLDAYIVGADTPELPPDTAPAPGVKYRRFGRFTGAIGPWTANEPLASAGPRRLYGRSFDTSSTTTVPWFVPSANSASFTVDTTKRLLSVDLSNALCRAQIGGGPADYGTLTAYANPPGGAPVLIGVVPYTTMFDLASAICTIPIPPAAFAAVISSPISITTSRTDILGPVIWSEGATGIVVSVDNRVLRLTSEPGSSALTAAVDVYAMRFGTPIPQYQLSIAQTPVYGNTPGATVPPSNPGDTPSAVGALGVTISPTDNNGHATMTLTALKDPGGRTPLLDSQLYFVYPCPPGTNPINAVQQESQLSVVIWASYPVIATPQWSDIAEIMAVYDKLFPGMRNLVALTDEKSFYIFMNNPPWFPVFQQADPHYNVNGVSRGAIGWYLTRPDSDPTKMPVTRDLNPNKVTTVLNYVRNNPVVPTPPPSGPPHATPTT